MRMLLTEKMEMLTSGEYNVMTKKASVHERKSILFVKLTDSAQQALVDYLHSSNTHEVPLIEFEYDEGRLLIPNSSKNSDPEYMTQFKFDVCNNDTMQGKQGRLECVQHRCGSRQLLGYGQLTQRLRIHANEDIYEKTKNRMAAVEMQQRQNCTIQLDLHSTAKGSGFNRRFKPQPKCFLADNQHSTPNLLPQTSNMIRNKRCLVNNAPPKKINPATCLILKPLKERMVHLLALKPYRKPELEAVLKRDGLSNCDLSHIVETLNSVSTFHDNLYHLSKHAWNDVQEDWLFYTEQERQRMKKNKLQNLTSPSSSSNSGVSVTLNQSSNKNHPASPTSGSPSQLYKRPGYFNCIDGFQTKRQRISHFMKQEPLSRSQLASSQLCDSADNSHMTVANKAEKSSLLKSLATSLATSETKYSPRKEPQMTPPDSSLFSSDIFASVNSLCNGLLNNEPTSYQPHLDVPVMGVTAASDLNLTMEHQYEQPKYMKDYVTITNTEQRSRYKADFSRIFVDYQRMHKEVDKVSNLFAQLGEKLKEHRKGSRGYFRVEQGIYAQYHSLKTNGNFQDALRRYEYLHEKLSHIKNLVKEYDDEVRKQM